MEKRIAEIKRKTRETNISLKLNLDGEGKSEIKTGIEFLDHMLSLFSKHSLFDLTLKATGDIKVDFHHLTEDIGIVLGTALDKAVADKKGINRFAEAFVPMDDALILAAVDLGGRYYFHFDVNLKRTRIGNFDVELVEEFFSSFAKNAKMNLYLKQFYGKNTHHIIEACFKATARAVSSAVQLNPKIKGVPSTKGKI